MLHRIVFTLVALALPAGAAAQVTRGPTCVKSGPTVLCDDGSQYTTLGNTTTDDQGNVWVHKDEWTVGNDGSVIRRPSGDAYDPAPLAWPPQGQGALRPDILSPDPLR